MRPQKDKCTVSNGEDTVSYTANLYYNLREGHIYNTHMHNDPLFLIFFVIVSVAYQFSRVIPAGGCSKGLSTTLAAQ